MLVRLYVNGSRSLKEKRRVLKSLIEHLRADYNLSVAEVDDQNRHRAAILAMVCVGNDESHVNSILDKAVNRLALDGRIVVIETELELW